jgi:cytochrome c oxidase assembly protein subunit 15
VPEAGVPIRRLFLFTTLLIFLQLILGATMRHQHAGLAIPDFPLAHGRIWPAMDAASIQNYNTRLVESTAANPITAFQVGLQMAHRLMALAILVCVGTVAGRMGTPVSDPARTARDSQRPELETGAPLRRLAFLWLGLIFMQIGLGAWTIWSNKAADVATAHVLVGALSLVTGVVGCLICFRRFARGREAHEAPSSNVPCDQCPAVAINS